MKRFYPVILFFFGVAGLASCGPVLMMKQLISPDVIHDMEDYERQVHDVFYGDQPLHPSIIATFFPNNDQPQVEYFLLTADHDQVAGEITIDEVAEDQRWIRASNSGPEAIYRHIGYRIVGQLDNGDMVLFGYWNGGGSGTFGHIMVMGLACPNDQKYLRLSSILPTGDRWDGSIMVYANQIILGPVSPFRAERIGFPEGHLLRDGGVIEFTETSPSGCRALNTD